MTFASYVLLSVLLFWTRSGILSFTDEQPRGYRKVPGTFADTGIYENKLYDGMKDFLEEATRQGAS